MDTHKSEKKIGFLILVINIEFLEPSGVGSYYASSEGSAIKERVNINAVVMTWLATTAYLVVRFIRYYGKGGERGSTVTVRLSIENSI